MAKLSKSDLLKLAKLSRLSLTDGELAEFTEELSAILAYVEQLEEVDIDGLKPTNQVTGLTNVMREDQVADYGYEAKDLLENLPDRQNDFIKVKRMIG